MNEPKLLNVPVGDCAPGPWFNRTDLNLTPEFLADIQQHGVRQTLIVRPRPNPAKDEPRYEIVAGIRRWSAAVKTQRATVPVNVCAMTDPEAREARLVENLQRENLTALDEAKQMEEALATGDYGTGSKAKEALAASLGVSRSQVYDRLRLRQAGPALLEAMTAGRIPATVAGLLATLPGEALQQKALKRVLENGHYAYDHDDDYEAPPAKGGKGKRRTAAELSEDLERTETSRREPMSYRAVKAMLNVDFRLDLAEQARWKLEDAKLLPSAGACATCPKRSGTVPGAFPEIKNPNLCTDPDCFAAKRALADAAALQAHVDKGHKVMTPEEHKKAFANSYNLGGGWMAADDYVYNLKGDGYGGKPAGQLLGKSMPEPTYAVNREGKAQAFYKRSEVEAVARSKGLLKAEAKPEKPPAAETPEEKARREKAEAAERLQAQIKAATLEAAVGEILEPVETLKDFSKWAAPLFHLLFARLDDGDFVNHELLVRRRGWQGGHVRDHAKKLGGAQMLALLVEVFLVEDSYSNEYDEELLKKMAATLGVKPDWKALEKMVRARLMPPTETPAKAAKAGKPAKAKTKAKK